MTAYHKDRVSEEFRQLADLADARFRANLRTRGQDPAAVAAHDELLAHACVYGYLYDRHFLSSPDKLLNELRWLRSGNRPEAPRHCVHPARFDEQRTALLDLLIARFRNLIDYRNELDPSEAPSPDRPGEKAKLCATEQSVARSHATVGQSSGNAPR